MTDPMEELERNNEAHSRAMVEAHKMEFDIHKTQATLVTGSLVAVVALSSILVPDEARYLWILGVSCILLLYSMGWALAGMIGLMTAVMLEMTPYDTRTQEEKDESEGKRRRSRWQALVSFPLGLGIFALYVWLNALV